MSDSIVGLRLRVMSFIFYNYPFFFLSLYYMLTFKIFMLELSQKFLKLEC